MAGEKAYPDGYLHAKDRMVHMHVKSVALSAPTGKRRSVAVSKGEIDYRGQFKTLTDGEYSVVSLSELIVNFRAMAKRVQERLTKGLSRSWRI